MANSSLGSAEALGDVERRGKCEPVHECARMCRERVKYPCQLGRRRRCAGPARSSYGVGGVRDGKYVGLVLWLEGATEKGGLVLRDVFPPELENRPFFFTGRLDFLSKALPLPGPLWGLCLLIGPQLEPPAPLPNSGGAGSVPACPFDSPSTHR